MTDAPVGDRLSIPPAYTMIWSVVQALRELGGSGRIAEINDKVSQIRGFSDQQQEIVGSGSRPEIAYRLAWARTHAKNLGLLANPSRGVWALTKDGQEIEEHAVDERRRANDRGRVWVTGQDIDGSVADDGHNDAEVADTDDTAGTGEEPWQSQALEVLRGMDPGAFERLSQRLLRQAGFINVAVTGRSGDGGIDGTGVYRMSLVSFPVFFQCKRYSGAVGSSQVRDFRGAMIGRGEKGLLITTGTFTSGARAEATRDGAPPLDLIDGEELVELLREHELGITTTERVVQDITVRPEFFADI
jgi:restriction system protein